MPERKWDVPKRYLRLHLYQDTKEKKTLSFLTEDVHVKFDTTAACTGALTEANITIGGIKVAKMFGLATSSTLWIKDWLQHRIVITAGYTNPDRYATIFDGTVMDAVANLDTADYSVTIKATTGFEKLPIAKSYSFPGAVPVATIAKAFADDNGWAFVDALQDPTVTINNYATREHSVVEQLREITMWAPVDLYVDKGRLYLKRRGTRGEGLPTLKIYSNDIIGTPRPTQTGCKIKVRMNPWARSGQQVEVHSLKYPDLNSIKFYLDVLSHAGDTYGSDWFTELNLTKDGMGYYKNE